MTPSASGRAATIKDVAALAGVSWKTVTNVVHGRDNVAPATRARVLAAISELDYRPDIAGRTLRQGRSRALTLVVPDIVNPYFSRLVEAVFDAADERGYAVFVESAGRQPAEERRAASSLLRFAFDGVLFSPTHTPPAALTRLATRMPVVLLGENTAGTTLDVIAIDNVTAAQKLTAHLIDLGRRRIAFLGHRPTGPLGPGRQRIDGYSAALRAAGITPDPSLLVEVGEFDEADGADATARMLATTPDVDGLVCANDLLAFGALHALRRAGVRVPEDVAVTGWDDTPHAAYANPTLTTVRPDLNVLAATAVDRLVTRIEQPGGPPTAVLVPYEIVVRESSIGLTGGVSET
ncbi:LacI family transcriptional regulator [Allokutzneria sp. A3M-2-11 16]|uniref:LacI family DNA-binding transcriptional regulator n=1 Tax=Allokutzneria sp. A3M-2-11 16 TaxID=2962043 RepID=UPI0020B8C508|nr:LacI family DNA-binding transcriptional regulator [Allokutzneria sp. A3M-2-11 16]MCP3801964.1 LacI family transcriptional regulator [Allokutzneria sp. A3M-2-11 16]